MNLTFTMLSVLLLICTLHCPKEVRQPNGIIRKYFYGGIENDQSNTAEMLDLRINPYRTMF
jgi:hypothetical protein